MNGNQAGPSVNNPPAPAEQTSTEPLTIEPEKKKNIGLFSFNQSRKLIYKGLVHLNLYDTPSKQLIQINPDCEDEILIPFSFQFIQIKNLFCIVGRKQRNDLILLFQTDAASKKVFEYILKRQKNYNIENLQNLFDERFRGPLLDGVENNDEINQRLKEIIKDHLSTAGSSLINQQPIQTETIPTINMAPIDFGENNFDGAEVANQEKENIAPAESTEVEGNNSQLFVSEQTNNDEENEMDFEDKNLKPLKDKQKIVATRIFKSPDFELVKLKPNDLKNSRLTTFTLNNMGFNYYWSSKSKVFYCEGCRKLKTYDTKARLHKNADGSEFIVADVSHKCKAIDLKPFNKEENIFKAENFSYQNVKRNRIHCKDLVVLDKKDKNISHVFYNDRNTYVCGKCRNKGVRVNAVSLIDDTTGEKYFQVGPNDHVCDATMHYSASNENYQPPSSSVLNLESASIDANDLGGNAFDVAETSIKEINETDVIETRRANNAESKKSETLIIEINNDKENEIDATIEEENEEPPRKKTKIFNSSNFELIQLCPNNFNHSRLCIFTSDARNRCYYYYWNPSNKAFYCEGCRMRKTKNVINKATLIQNFDGTPQFIEADDTHSCKPRVYKPFNKEENIFKANQFSLDRCKTKSGNNSTNLVVYENDEQSLCRIFFKSNGTYVCAKCRAKSTKVYGIILKDEKANQKYIQVGPNNHACKAVPYLTKFQNKNQASSAAEETEELVNESCSISDEDELDESYYENDDFINDPVCDSGPPEESTQNEISQTNLVPATHFEAKLDTVIISRNNLDHETNFNIDDSPNISSYNLNLDVSDLSNYKADSVSKTSEKQTQTNRETSEINVDSPTNSILGKVSPRISPVKLKLKKDGTYMNLKSGSNSPTTSVNETSQENEIPPTNLDFATNLNADEPNAFSTNLSIDESSSKKLLVDSTDDGILNCATNLINVDIPRNYNAKINLIDSETLSSKKVESDLFICEEDAHSSKWVYAKLIKDENYGDYLIQTKIHEHCCRPMPYLLMTPLKDEILLETSEYNKFLENPIGSDDEKKKVETKKVEKKKVEKIDFNPRDLFAPESDDDQLESSPTSTTNFMEKENNKDNLKRKFDPQNTSMEWNPENKKFKLSNNIEKNDNNEIHKIQGQQPKNSQKPLKSHFCIDYLLNS